MLPVEGVAGQARGRGDAGGVGGLDSQARVQAGVGRKGLGGEGATGPTELELKAADRVTEAAVGK